MIKETALPDRIACAWALNVFSKNLFERSDPLSQAEIIRAGDKEMNVIRHNDMSADSNVVLGVRPPGKVNEGITDSGSSQQLSAAISAERNEINRVTGKDASETRWEPGVRAHPVAAALWAARDERRPKVRRRQLSLRTAKRLQDVFGEANLGALI
jgi:hypothetical protein